MPASKKKATIKQSPKLPAEVRRIQIMQSAEKLFAKKGYRATTVEEIARSARLTKGAVYHHFGSKEDILVAMITSVANHFLRELRALPETVISPVDFFKTLKKIGQDPNLPKIRHDIDFRIQAVKIPRVRTLVRNAFDKGIELFSKRIDPIYASTPEGRRQLAVFVYSLWDGLALRNISYPGLVNLDHQEKILEKLFRPMGRVRSRKAT